MRPIACCRSGVKFVWALLLAVSMVSTEVSAQTGMDLPQLVGRVTTAEAGLAQLIADLKEQRRTDQQSVTSQITTAVRPATNFSEIMSAELYRKKSISVITDDKPIRLTEIDDRINRLLTEVYNDVYNGSSTGCQRGSGVPTCSRIDVLFDELLKYRAEVQAEILKYREEMRIGLGGLSVGLGKTNSELDALAFNSRKETKRIDEKIREMDNERKSVNNRLWILIAAILVFMMQPGFKALEVGLCRLGHSNGVAIKNLFDWIIVTIVFFFCGFALAFGQSKGGIIGFDQFLPNADTLGKIVDRYGLPTGVEFFLFQLGFAATAATIVSGVMAERTALVPYMVISAVTGGIAFPLVAHAAWAGALTETSIGWLEGFGFHDYAGSTVVHSVGAWIGLWGTYFLGHRTGMIDANGQTDWTGFGPSNLAYSVLGAFLLTVGWWGFNGGSAYIYALKAPAIILHTTLAGVGGGIIGLATGFLFARRAVRTLWKNQSREAQGKLYQDYAFTMGIGGLLGGMVAITACADVMSAPAAFGVGCLAGIVHNYVYWLLFAHWRLTLDDPVGAIAVHGGCGVFGTLAVAFGMHGLDLFPLVKQLWWQCLGIGYAFAVCTILAWLLFPLLGLFGLHTDSDGGSIVRPPNPPQ